MLISDNIIQFNNLANIDFLIHGFSTKSFGSFRPDNPDLQNSLSLFSNSLGISPKDIALMEQVHSNTVNWLTSSGNKAKKTDGILTKNKRVFLGVLSADCLPILIFDRKKNICGAIHAGWKGIYSEILKSAISRLKKKGSAPNDMLIAIGPCIRSCCYNVSENRIQMFTDKFPNFTDFFIKHNAKVFLDLPSIAKQQLLEEGIPSQNIEDCNLCTSDNNEKFFSFREEGKNFGEFIGIIGIVSSKSD